MSAATATVSEVVAYAFEHGATYVASHRPVTFSDAAMWEMVDGDPVQEPLRREEYDMGREVVQMTFPGTNRVGVPNAGRSTSDTARGSFTTARAPQAVQNTTLSVVSIVTITRSFDRTTPRISTLSRPTSNSGQRVAVHFRGSCIT